MLQFNGVQTNYVMYNGVLTTGMYNGQVVWIPSNGFITVDLNNQWKEYDVSDNSELSSYRLFYSNSNFNVSNSTATCYLSANKEFDVGYCSVAEGFSCDYLYFNDSEYDEGITTRGEQSSDSACLDNYNIAGFNGNTTVNFRKDGSADVGFDRGYIILKKEEVKEVLNG